MTDMSDTISPQQVFIQMADNQKQKENARNEWNTSKYKVIPTLQSNNVGIVGETSMQRICDYCKIEAEIDGSKTKELGGGVGDGVINGKSVEIKTACKGSFNPTFQHELGESPWKAEFMVFIDVAPMCIYLTIFNNFDEESYKSRTKCKSYFITKSVTWRKGSGAFKLDTTVKINEENIIKGHTVRIDSNTMMHELRTYILSQIE